MSKPQFHPAADATSLKPGEGRTVNIQGREFALFNHEGTFCALDNECPHVGGPLGAGWVENGKVYCPMHGWAFDVIDLRSIFPYDWDMISASVAKTGRILFANEDTEVTNFGEHLLRRVIEDHFYDLSVRPRMLMGKHVPGIGMHQNYELNTVPQLGHIREAMRELAEDPS